MVSYEDILNNNESLKVSGSGVTAVFVGATAGIGLGALQALTKHTDAPTIYIVGRSETKLSTIIKELKQLNDTVTFIPIIANDLSLISDAQEAALQIAKQATKIDLLIMSCGYIGMTRDESPEGLDRLTVVRYYARTRFLVTLAPLLRAAPSPRVVSVGGAGNEGPMWADDLKLEHHYSLVNAAGASTSMATLFMEEFAKQPENEKMVLIHTFPGFVGGTGLTMQVAWYTRLVIEWIVGPLMKLFGYTPEEAGERVIFAATNGRFRRLKQGMSAEGTLIQKGSNGELGSGVYLVLAKSEVTTENKALKQLKDEGYTKIVWDHTFEEFGKVDKS